MPPLFVIQSEAKDLDNTKKYATEILRTESSTTRLRCYAPLNDKFIYLFFFLFFPLCLHAQEKKRNSIVQEHKIKLTSLANGMGDKIIEKVKDFNAIDTTYISPNLYNLAFMLEHSTWYEHYRLGNNS